MELRNRILVYAAFGALTGLVISLSASMMYGVVHVVHESSATLDLSSPRLPSVFRVTGAYVIGGTLAGAVWGGLLPLTRRLWGAVTVAFIGGLPVFLLLYLAVDAGNLSVGVSGILLRSIAWAIIVGIGWVGLRVRVIRRNQKSQDTHSPSGGTSAGSSNCVERSSGTM